MENNELMVEVVRMLREREDYYTKGWQTAVQKHEKDAMVLFGKMTAYNSARQMVMAALLNEKEILMQYDYFAKEV